MSLLSIIQDAAVKVGVEKPTYVVGNPSTEVMELLAFANEEVREIAKRVCWQALRKEKTFVSLAAEEQESLPSDFGRFVDETFWNRSRKRPLRGPLSAKEWQNNKSWGTTLVVDTFTYRGNKILVSPTPAAGETFAYEYITKNAVYDIDGSYKATWTKDTDTCLLDEALIDLGVSARFKLAKGLDASADIAKYETQVGLSISQDGPKSTVNMSIGSGSAVQPGVVIPDGYWTV